MFKPRDPNSFFSEPNVITLGRFIFSLFFFILAIRRLNPTYNFIALGIHWVGDVLDGLYARKLKQETILGAEIDIISDRIAVLFFYINYLYFNPNLIIPVAIYLINFAFVDFYLSYQFLKFNIISPNYFYKIDHTVFILNFSYVGKFCNSTVVTLILIFAPRFQVFALIFALILIGVKIYSIYRLTTNELSPYSIHKRSQDPLI